jgi:hypothetical protein
MKIVTFLKIQRTGFLNQRTGRNSPTSTCFPHSSFHSRILLSMTQRANIFFTFFVLLRFVSRCVSFPVRLLFWLLFYTALTQKTWSLFAFFSSSVFSFWVCCCEAHLFFGVLIPNSLRKRRSQNFVFRTRCIGIWLIILNPKTIDYEK